MIQRLKLQDYVNVLRAENLLRFADISEEILDTDIDFISYDTRKLQGKSLFICKGAHFREEFLEYAVSNGAVAYVAEAVHKTSAPHLIVTDVRHAIVVLGQLYFDKVTDKLVTIGITGTKGKTTTSYYIRSIMDAWFNELGKPACAMLSTVETYDGVSTEESHLTTPEILELYEHFENAYKSGISHLVMEVSSQALKYGRVRDMNFEVGAFLNISPDHISPYEHLDFEDYFTSKLKLFDMVKYGCVNSNAAYAQRVIDYAKDRCELITFGTHETDTVYCESMEKREDGIYFTVKSPVYNGDFSISMPGFFNVSNALCAMAVSMSLGVPESCVSEGLRTARAKGRMQVYTSDDKQVVIIVDYAHNGLSFDTLFDSVKKEYPGYKLISVFGSAGMKAFDRREELGTSAGNNCDFVYITEDDPGEEDPMKIAQEIEQYVHCPHTIDINRTECVRRAVFEHDGPRVIVVAGKGVESTMKRGLKHVPCISDPESAEKYISLYNENLR